MEEKLVPVSLLHAHYSFLASPLPQENRNYLFWSDWYNAIKYICYQHAIQLCNFSQQTGMTNRIYLHFAFDQRCVGPWVAEGCCFSNFCDGDEIRFP